MQHQEQIQSTISYCTSIGCIVIGWFVDNQDVFAALTVFVGFLIGVIRLSHDLGLTRFLKKKLFKKNEHKTN